MIDKDRGRTENGGVLFKERKERVPEIYSTRPSTCPVFLGLSQKMANGRVIASNEIIPEKRQSWGDNR